MKNLIFSFIKPSPDSIVASSRIALFLAEELKAPLTYKGDVSDEEVDTLFLVNGAFAFCKCLPELYKAVTTAKRIVWVQNDYTITPPKNTGDAQSPFRKAFVDRKLAGLPDIDYWTTIEPNATKTKGSAYINWNALTYKSLSSFRTPTAKDLFYYGSYREKREPMFRKYLLPDTVKVTVSSPSDKFESMFMGKPTRVEIMPKIQSVGFYEELEKHGLGLYIDDPLSQREFHSPANRFYEMLSAGLPMAFAEESARMLSKMPSGILVNDFIVDGSDDKYKRLMKNLPDVQLVQQKMWAGDYKKRLRKELKLAAQCYGGVL